MHVVVIGNGVAGETAARVVRTQAPSCRVTIISEEREPLYSPCIFCHFLSGEIGRERLFIRSHDDYRQAGVSTLLGRKVRQVDPGSAEVHLDDESIQYDKLILATGSEPVIPGVQGRELQGVFTLKSMRDLDQVEAYIRGSKAKKAAVLGSGPVGLEIAISLRKRGLEVILLEMLDRVLPKILDDKLAAVVEKRLEENGVRVILGQRVTSIGGNQQVEAVLMEQASYPCDLVCIATGMKPRVQLARAAGARIGKSGGIEVDSSMRTSVEGIYACGDCVETKDVSTGERSASLLWHTAKHQAFVAGSNCAGTQAVYPGSLNYAVLELFGWRVISSGHVQGDFVDRAVRMKEIDQPGAHMGMIIENDCLLGLQFVGRRVPQEVPWLLGFIRKPSLVRDDLKSLAAQWGLHGSFSHWSRALAILN